MILLIQWSPKVSTLHFVFIRACIFHEMVSLDFYFRLNLDYSDHLCFQSVVTKNSSLNIGYVCNEFQFRCIIILIISRD